MKNWIEGLASASKDNQSSVLITILKVEGSSPRDQQTKMVVTASQIFDSIGGGNLEYQAMGRARELLKQNKAVTETKRFTLGTDLTQCCGGRVELLFECIPACDFNIAICGAGHVATALVKILADLPCRVSWVDNRAELLESAYGRCGAPQNISIQQVEQPLLFVEQCAPNSIFLVMTHSHDIDYDYCEAVLASEKQQFCGLIGSRSKAAKFRSRLGRKGFNQSELEKLVSPIGLNLGAGKQPMEVAVAIAAQIMQYHHTRNKTGNIEYLTLVDSMPATD